MSPYARRRRCRGTIIIFFLVMVSILTTSLLTTMALTSGVGTQMASLTLKRDQAYYAAEAGIQNGFWVLQNNNNWRAAANAPFVRTIGNAAFSLSAVGDWNSPILLTSVGTVSDSAATTCSWS